MNVEYTSFEFLLALSAIAFGMAADIYYFFGMRKPGHTPPNRWSWLIFSFSAYVEVLTYHEVSGDIVKVIPLATTPVACTVILWFVWKLREDKWENRLEMAIDIFSVVASFSAIIIWLVFSKELWAHTLMVIAVPVSYLPIWRSCVKFGSKRGEDLPWKLWSAMDALNLSLSLHRLNDVMEVPYIAVELVCHVVTWFLVVKFRRSA